MTKIVNYSYQAMKRFAFLSTLNEAKILLNHQSRNFLEEDNVDLYKMTAWDLEMYFQLDRSQAAALSRRLRREDFLETIEFRLQQAIKSGLKAITLNDPLYPEPLRHIASPPSILWALGNQIEASLSQVAVTIVGTRAPSPYGQRLAKELGRYLALRGATVISGMALGIDGLAQEAAIDAHGRTIAVLASGVDHIYPEQHIGLYHKIADSGALISEYPPGMPSHPSRFPVRNRIIAGMTEVTVIIESTMRSGTLITANMALQEGRDVMVVPGNIYSPTSKGTNSLLFEGAEPLLDFNQLKKYLQQEREIELTDQSRIILPQTDDEDENAVIRMLASENLAIDQVFSAGNWPMDKLIQIIASLEAKGHIRSYRGRYALTSRVDLSI